MNKLFNIILGLGFLLILGAGIYQLIGPSLPPISTRDKQIAYLKEHEQEMTDYVKSQNPKVESVQWDWESIEQREIQPNAGGIPTGKKYKEVTIKGVFNNIERSNFRVGLKVSPTTGYPEMENIYLKSPFRVGGRLYE
ncbi:hypothetical protein BU202_05075 [Streptococcus cuniculi]|uniref:Uncharacterized protein n=1 Tax=Streptococcus cuniculi TaxID=1432788 RepID=A0A1Q8E7R4_9STRE|nr:hypothetical protein [Streptococcus cuniculi]OLF47841.1 hypothetical protein BU202_05075 [Streptococcus cuniculi]